MPYMELAPTWLYAPPFFCLSANFKLNSFGHLPINFFAHPLAEEHCSIGYPFSQGNCAHPPTVPCHPPRVLGNNSKRAPSPFLLRSPTQPCCHPLAAKPRKLWKAFGRRLTMFAWTNSPPSEPSRLLQHCTLNEKGISFSRDNVIGCFYSLW